MIFTAYEVKVSRSDFLADEKWPNYREVCHRFYWACPAGLIQPEEVADDCGLVWYNPETGGLSTRKKALFRDIEMPTLLLYYVVLSRLGQQERHPFFSNRREYLEARVQDKVDRQQFGYRVGTKMARLVAEAAEREKELQSRITALEERLKKWEQVKAVLEQHGVDTYWNVAGRLRERLQTTVSADVVDSLRRIERETGTLLRMMALEKEAAD